MSGEQPQRVNRGLRPYPSLTSALERARRSSWRARFALHRSRQLTKLWPLVADNN